MLPDSWAEFVSRAGPYLWRALAFVLKFWWIYVPIILWNMVVGQWRSYTRQRYLAGMKWVLLEITPPPDVIRSPKIAENLFAGLHASYTGGTSDKKQFFEGKVPDWFSFEIVGTQGQMRFFVRTTEGSRHLLEAQIFAQYPDAEIHLVEDYTAVLPAELPTDQADIFGTELIFTKENAYPIKTYEEFEEAHGKDDNTRLDPLAPLAEVISVLGPGEHICVQILVRPTGGDWVKDAQGVIDKMLGKTPKAPERDAFAKVIDYIDGLLPGGAAAPADKPKDDNALSKLTPGQKFVLEKIEEKIAKLGFKTGIRFVYVAQRETFNRARVSSVIGMFKQLSANNLNGFKPNGDVTTSGKGSFAWLFPSDKGFGAAEEEFEKKKKIWKAFKSRSFVSDKTVMVLNTEELATIFHLPGLNLKAPAVPRVDMKKSQPPLSLPTIPGGV